MATSSPIVHVPTRREVQNIRRGSHVLDCFGSWSEVAEVTGRGDDVKGRAFVCCSIKWGDTSTISGSFKEGELVRTVALTARHTSA